MFFEIDPEFIKKTEHEPHRRWFRDSEAACDLIIWENDDKQIDRFQFWHQDALIEWKNGRGLTTGHVDKTSGAFTHYQSEIYRIHQNFDDDILSLVTGLLHQKNVDQEDTLTQVKQILFEIATRY